MSWTPLVSAKTWVRHLRRPVYESFSYLGINQDYTIQCAIFLLCMFSQGFAFLAYPLGFACFSSFFPVSLDSAASDSRLDKSSTAC